jgi:hypothetical protein
MMGHILRQMTFHFFFLTFLALLIVIWTESENHSLDQLMTMKELGQKAEYTIAQ